MDTVFAVLGGLAGVALGLLAGYFVGVRLRELHSSIYWVANGVVLILGILGNSYGLVNQMMWLVVASLGFIGGGLTGLKYGYAHVVGQWRRGEDAVVDESDA